MCRTSCGFPGHPRNNCDWLLSWWAIPQEYNMNISHVVCSKKDKWCKNVLHDCEKDRMRWSVVENEVLLRMKWWRRMLKCIAWLWEGENMMMNDVVSICAMWCDVVRCRGTDAGLTRDWCARCRGTDAEPIAIDYSVDGLFLNNYKWVQLMGFINLNISQLRCCKTWKMLEWVHDVAQWGAWWGHVLGVKTDRKNAITKKCNKRKWMMHDCLTECGVVRHWTRCRSQWSRKKSHRHFQNHIQRVALFALVALVALFELFALVALFELFELFALVALVALSSS